MSVLLLFLVRIGLAGLDAQAAPIQASPEPQRGVPGLTEAAVVEAVLQSNASLRAAAAAQAAAQHRTRGTRALPDPTLQVMTAPGSYGAQSGAHGAAHHSGPGLMLSLQQGLPGWGTRAAEQARAEGAAAAATGSLAAAQVALVAEARTRWVTLHRLHEFEALLTEQARLLTELEQAAQRRYQQGAAPQSAALDASLRRAKLEEQRLLLVAERGVEVAHLNALLHRPPDATLGAPQLEGAATLPPDPPADGARHPQVAAAAGQQAAAAGGAALERARARPQVAVLGQYNSMWTDPSHRWMLGLGLQVPLAQRARRARIDAATADQAAADARLDRVRDEVAAAQAQAGLHLEAQRLRLDLYDDRLLPLARARLAALERDYAAGAVPLSGVLDGADALLALQQAQLDAWVGLRVAQIRHDQSQGRIPDGADQ